jgi:hypothetical protein
MTTSRDVKARELVEELILTARNMSAAKRSWLVMRLMEGLGTDAWKAKSALMDKVRKEGGAWPRVLDL